MSIIILIRNIVVVILEYYNTNAKNVLNNIRVTNINKLIFGHLKYQIHQEQVRFLMPSSH